MIYLITNMTEYKHSEEREVFKENHLIHEDADVYFLFADGEKEAIKNAIDYYLNEGHEILIETISFNSRGEIQRHEVSQKWFIEKCAEHYLSDKYGDCDVDEHGVSLKCDDWVKATDAYDDFIEAANEDFSEGSDAQEHSTYWGHP